MLFFVHLESHFFFIFIWLFLTICNLVVIMIVESCSQFILFCNYLIILRLKLFFWVINAQFFSSSIIILLFAKIIHIYLFFNNWHKLFILILFKNSIWKKLILSHFISIYFTWINRLFISILNIPTCVRCNFQALAVLIKLSSSLFSKSIIFMSQQIRLKLSCFSVFSIFFWK